jgi:hypothetical protein
MNTASKINFRSTTRKQVRSVWDTPLLAAGFFILFYIFILCQCFFIREHFA